MSAQRTGAWLMALAAAMLPLNAALAQTADQEAFKKYLASSEHQRMLDAATAHLPPEVFQRCPALVAPGSSVAIVQPIAMGADGKPAAGTWWQRFPVKGCGNDTVLNFYFTVGADKKIAITTALPGTTRADLTLQRDALFYAGLGSRARAKDCKSLKITNTKFESFGSHDHPTQSPAAGKFQPWWETWTVKGCGHTFSVPMDFAPDATGTVIKQRPDDIHGT